MPSRRRYVVWLTMWCATYVPIDAEDGTAGLFTMHVRVYVTGYPASGGYASSYENQVYGPLSLISQSMENGREGSALTLMGGPMDRVPTPYFETHLILIVRRARTIIVFHKK
jgi:hypothetical protein